MARCTCHRCTEKMSISLMKNSFHSQIQEELPNIFPAGTCTGLYWVTCTSVRDSIILSLYKDWWRPCQVCSCLASHTNLSGLYKTHKHQNVQQHTWHSSGRFTTDAGCVQHLLFSRSGWKFVLHQFAQLDQICEISQRLSKAQLYLTLREQWGYCGLFTVGSQSELAVLFTDVCYLMNAERCNNCRVACWQRLTFALRINQDWLVSCFSDWEASLLTSRRKQGDNSLGIQYNMMLNLPHYFGDALNRPVIVLIKASNLWLEQNTS